ncbi:MAG: hypothetical protein INR62_01590 [Rhodospirillales bacterium]|nr:hypothetical protein [Acetobacter sp.]
MVELLVVMAIIMVLLAVTVPTIRGVMSGRNVSGGVDAVSGYLSYARTQAVAQNTYVVVGFYQDNNSDDLLMASVFSANGTFSPSSFASANVIGPTAKYPALGKTIHINNVTLVPWANLSSQLKTKVAGPDGNITVECSASPKYTTNSSYFSFQIGSKSFPYCVIAFSPQGEALFFPNDYSGAANFSANLPFYSQLFIGLRATRGGNVIANDVDSAAITLDGGSGDIKTYRL